MFKRFTVCLDILLRNIVLKNVNITLFVACNSNKLDPENNPQLAVIKS